MPDLLLDKGHGYREKKLFEIPRFKSFVMFTFILIERSNNYVPNRHKFNLSAFFFILYKAENTMCTMQKNVN